MLRSAARFTILDHKGDFAAFGGIPVRRDFNPRLLRQLIRPESMEATEQIIDAHVDRGDAILYIDEMTLCNPSRAVLVPAVGRAIRTGRSLGVGVWSGSQRPKDIPSAVFTEAEHFFVFRLTYGPDRDKVIAFTNDDLRAALARVRGHDHVYYDVLTERGYYVRARG